ncbi:phosphodiester glycosidase family protein [Aquipuribacter sp. MA13-6]|uniref:phosphodiester glycosidase family protein n=1 Tax=unclassified Aquipuribacter TaxID=2635084 RepID=UPI003EED3526
MTTPPRPRALAAGAALLALPLALGTSLPAWAANPGPTTAEQRSAAGSDTGEPLTQVERLAGDRLTVSSSSTDVAPGVERTSARFLDARGWLDVDLLRVDLAGGANDLQLLTPEFVADTATVPEMAAGTGSVAAINGDFFHISGSGAALGGEVRDGEVRKGPDPGRTNHAGLTTDGLGSLASLVLAGTVTAGGTEHPLAGLNQQGLAAGVAVYTPEWGDVADLTYAVGGQTATFVAVTGTPTAGTVASVTTDLASTTIPEDGYLLLGRGATAAPLAALQPGDPVGYALDLRGDAQMRVALAGGDVLVRDGVVPSTLNDVDLAPRTAIGFGDDGETMYLLVIDGRQSDSRGTTIRETGEVLRDAGAEDGLNLDGGGSSTMLARSAGDAEPTLVNDPSDGGLRADANGLGLTTAPGSGRPVGIRIAPLDAVTPGTADDVVGLSDGLDRVFPGLTRRLSGTPHDETFGPAPAAVRWTSDRTQTASVRQDADGDALVTGRRTGTTQVVATAGRGTGAVRATSEVRVLGRLQRLAVEPATVALEDAGASTRMVVVGFDADGFRAPVDPMDVEVTAADDVVDVTADGVGYTVTATTGGEATVLTVRVGDVVTYVPVTTGLATLDVEDFAFGGGVGGWYASEVGAPGPRLSSTTGRDGTAASALRLDYDFSGTRSTRAAYMNTPGLALPLPGEPRRIRMSVDGDGRGAWFRAVVRDAAGTTYTVNLTEQASGVSWTGWRTVSAAIPAGVQYPLTLRQVYPVETVGAERYTGSLAIDDLAVDVAQSVDVPATEQVQDRIVLGSEDAGADSFDSVVAGEDHDDRWTFAVMNDAQFTAAGAAGTVVRDTRRVLREIVAADPEFLVINGDFVDTSYPADFALAKRILEEEVGDAFPVHYSPGNHEVLGTSRIDEFVDAFGETRRTFDHEGTRFVLLNSAFGTLRGSDYQQLVDLRASLDDAVTDPSVDHVVVMSHHPVDDPGPAKNSQLADRLEAAMLQQWLAEFEADSGKDAAYVAGHAGTFDATRADGSEYLVVGNTAKDASTAPGDGGFTGWVELGVDRDATDWLLADVNPVTDSMASVGDGQVVVGTSDELRATLTQPGGRVVPVGWPMSVSWAGDDVHVVRDGERVPRRAVASYDPATGELVGLRAGTGTLTVRTGTGELQIPVSVTG